MKNVYICGIGMSRFGRYGDQSLKQLASIPIDNALRDAGLERRDLQAAYVGNSMAGIMTGQEAIRGQTILSANGISSIPVINVENACATGSTALNQACLAVRAEEYDVVLVLGVEKLFHTDRAITYRALTSATDIELSLANETSSVFLEESSRRLNQFMEDTGATIEHVARVASKSHYHASLNPLAQYQQVYSVQEVLDSPMVMPPLTRAMCSPIGDGAAALIVCSERKARELGRQQVRIAASVLRSAGTTEAGETGGVLEKAVYELYEQAGIGPQDLSLAEVHDTTAASELMLYEQLGFCTRAEVMTWVENNEMALGGRLPVNTSGGLVSRGHPPGATGVAQIYEIVHQLRGSAQKRQVPNARAALAHNAGGVVNNQPAALCLHVLVA